MNACSISATKWSSPTTASTAIAGRWFWFGETRPPARCCPACARPRKRQDFGIAQFTSASCAPALNVDVPGTPNCRAINDKVLSLAQRLKPDIVLLHGTWERHLDSVAETVAALKKTTERARHCAGFGAVVETRTAERGAALFHAASSLDFRSDPIARLRPIRPATGCVRDWSRWVRNSSRCGTRCATRTAA